MDGRAVTPWATSSVEDLLAQFFAAIASVLPDDVDRLDAPELVALLKAIRLLGRFPGVHYLLAYDQTTLVHVLQRSGTVGDEQRALAYLCSGSSPPHGPTCRCWSRARSTCWTCSH